MRRVHNIHLIVADKVLEIDTQILAEAPANGLNQDVAKRGLLRPRDRGLRLSEASACVLAHEHGLRLIEVVCQRFSRSTSQLGATVTSVPSFTAVETLTLVHGDLRQWALAGSVLRAATVSTLRRPLSAVRRLPRLEWPLR